MTGNTTVLLLLGYVLLCAFGDETIKILRIFPETEEQLIRIKEIGVNLKFEADFLVPVYTTGIPGDLLVSSKDMNKITNYLNTLGVEYKEIVNKEPSTSRRRRSASKRIELHDVKSEYLSYSEQGQLVQQITSDSPTFAWSEIIGTTTEKRRIWQITFGYPAPNGIEKPLLFMVCGIHAREWIASASCINGMWKLGYETEWKELLEQIDIVIVPNANPDGYEYTKQNKTGNPGNPRLWRKNRAGPFPGKKLEIMDNGTTIEFDYFDCMGVDLNRNFPFKFDYEDKKQNVGRSKNGCTETFAGPSPLSEIEASNLYSSIKSKLKHMKGFLDIHAFSQLILLPWAYGFNIENENLNDLRRLATVIRESIDSYNGTQYRIMSTPELYPAPGAMFDAVHALGVKYSYVLELPPVSGDVGYNNFELPADQIPEVSDGIFRGLVGLAKEIIKENPLSKTTKEIQTRQFVQL